MDQRPKQPQPIKPPVRQPSLPPDVLWEGHMEHYSQLVKRSKLKEGSKPLAPPQGTNAIPGIRIAFMNLGGGEPGFNTNPKAQRAYQKVLIRAIRALISSGMTVIAITGLNDFWFEFLKHQIPCWQFIHDGGTVSIGYDKATCILKDSATRKIYEDGDPQSRDAKLGWRTYFGAMFDVGDLHPYHFLAVVSWPVSHASPTEDLISHKFKEKIATDAMRAVLLRPSILAGLEKSSTIWGQYVAIQRYVHAYGCNVCSRLF